MESATIRRLADLNRAFYDQHAENFADSRPRLAPGAARLLADLRPGARVLELGCGDGKAARRLARDAPPAFYLGLDGSLAMLLRARRYCLAAGALPPQTGFALADLSAGALPLSPAAFDCALAFAVLHHLPGFDTRARLMAGVAARLAPGGRALLSNWQFTRSARLLERVVPWAAAGLTEADVEPGDYLVAWERKGRQGVRYIHLLDAAEARQLAERAGLAVLDVFSSDGRSNRLAEYVVMSRV